MKIWVLLCTTGYEFCPGMTLQDLQASKLVEDSREIKVGMRFINVY